MDVALAPLFSAVKLDGTCTNGFGDDCDRTVAAAHVSRLWPGFSSGAAARATVGAAIKNSQDVPRQRSGGGLHERPPTGGQINGVYVTQFSAMLHALMRG